MRADGNKKKCEETISYIQDLPKQRDIEESLWNIEKNLIILNNGSHLKEVTPQSIKIWIFKMENLFDLLDQNRYALKSEERIRISLNYISDSIIDWYIRQQKHIKTWEDFKQQLIDKYSIKETNTNLSFKVNDWVRIYDEKDFPYKSNCFETGLIIGMVENDLYEVTCRGKVLKIHGSNIEKL